MNFKETRSPTGASAVPEVSQDVLADSPVATKSYGEDTRPAPGSFRDPPPKRTHLCEPVQGRQDLQSPQDLSEYRRLRADATTTPHDTTAWQRLLKYAERSGVVEQVTDAYETLLKVYPNNASVQIAYLHYILDRGLSDIARSLFSCFLPRSPSVEIWTLYLAYVRKLNTEPLQQLEVMKAYEYALHHIGQDKDSGEIWREYIRYLNAAKTHTACEEQLKTDALRKLYRRAVQIPLENVDALWGELHAFVDKLDKMTATQILSDLSPSYHQARTILRQMKIRLSSLNQQKSSSWETRLQLPQPLTYTSKERRLLDGWKMYLLWEESDPLKNGDKDKAQLQTRIQLVYTQALVEMRFSPEIWYMAYSWKSRIGKQDDAIALLKHGMQANPRSYLLAFAYAEMQEQLKDYEEVNDMYTNFIEALHVELDQMDAAHQKELATAMATDSSTGSATASLSVVYGPNAPSPGLSVNSPVAGRSSVTTSSQASAHELIIADRREELGTVWIQYIKFARRAEGLQAARRVFLKARRDEKWITWQVFEAAALMEYHCTKETNAATRIFEHGLRLFLGEIEFIDKYLAYLISINDDKNARALFERTVPKFPGPNGKMLWDRWGHYEHHYSDLETMLKFDKRFADAFKDVLPIKCFATRHKYGMQLDAIASRDLGFGGPHTRALRYHETNPAVTGGIQESFRDAHNHGDRKRERCHDGLQREDWPRDGFATQGPRKRARR